MIQIYDAIKSKSPTIFIQGNSVAKDTFTILDPMYGTGVDINVEARRLGKDTGDDILFEWGSTFLYLMQKHQEEVKAALSPNDGEAFRTWLAHNPPKPL